LYRLAVDTGKFEVIRLRLGSDDRRLQALFVYLCSAHSSKALPVSALRSRSPVPCLPASDSIRFYHRRNLSARQLGKLVAFGSIGTPVLTLANVTGLPLLCAQFHDWPPLRHDFCPDSGIMVVMKNGS
jgi:hypothetical protein